MLITILCAAASADAQVRPDSEPAELLRITSPANGATVEPGGRLAVTVESAGAGDGDYIVLSPLGTSDPVATLPGRTFIDIRKDESCGRQPITAIGRTRAGQLITSRPVEIAVERSDPPRELVEINGMTRVSFTERGISLPMLLVATFADGTDCAVSRSTRIAYSSSNPRVARVDDEGGIWAMGVGRATVRAEYRSGGVSRALQVAVDVASLVITVAPTTIDFGTQPVGAISAPRRLSVTNTSTEPLKITTVHAPSELAVSGNCVGSTLRPGEGCALDVTFRPTASGARPLAIGIETDHTLMADPIAVTGAGRQ